MIVLKLKRNGWLFFVWKNWSPATNLTYEDNHVETDLCSLMGDLFWVCFVEVLLLAIVGLVVFWCVVQPILKFGIWWYLVVLAIFGGGIAGGCAIARWQWSPPSCQPRRRRFSELRKVVHAWIAAKKGKYCPKVEFR